MKTNIIRQRHRGAIVADNVGRHRAQPSTAFAQKPSVIGSAIIPDVGNNSLKRQRPGTRT